MAAFNYQWSSEWMDQPSATGAIEQMQAQLAEFERKIDAFGSRSSQNTYYQQQPSTIPYYFHLDWQNHQDYPWSNNDQDQFYAPSLAYPSPQPPLQKTNLEEILDRFLERTETWTNQERYAPSPLYSPLQSQELGPEYPIEPSYQSLFYEFSYQQLPQPQEEKPNLEEILAKFMAGTEQFRADTKEFMARIESRMQEQDNMMSQLDMNINSRSVEVQNLENPMEQLVNSDYCLEYALPIDTEVNPKEEEHCKAEILSDGKEVYEVVGQDIEYQAEQEAIMLKDQSLNTSSMDKMKNPRKEGDEFGNTLTLQIGEGSKEAVGRNLKKSHPNWEDDSFDGKKRIKICLQEEDIFKEIKILNAHEECYQVYMAKDVVKDESDDGSYYLPIVENEFGGGPQFHMNGEAIKEKTTRRHEMTIFVIEPD